MRRALASVVLCGLVAWSASASADQVIASRFELTETAHTVDVRLDRGVATLVVTRTVENRGPKSDQASFYLDTPKGAVATRLRAQGTHGEWFEGDLLEAEEAAKRYKELTGIGGYYPKDPALLSWRNDSLLMLQVFPVPEKSTKTVEYTWTMPMEYADGRYRLDLPALGTEALDAKVRFTAAHAEDEVEVNGVTLGAGSTVSGARPIDVALRPRNVAQVDGALASFAFSSGQHLIHARVSAAPRLSEIPARAAVVILLDVSRSMEGHVDEMVALARDYASWFPASDVELLTFDRKIASPFKGPLSGREMTARLHTFTPTLANGSQVDDALARADAILARSPLAARRVLLITDLETRAALTPDKVKGLASGAVLHVATLARDVKPAALQRDDDDVWSVVPRRSGGLLWRVALPVGPESRALVEALARPKVIERLTVTGIDEGFLPPSELAEGVGIEYFATASKSVPRVSLTGELWSKPVTWSAGATVEEGKTWSALVFGSPLYGSLGEDDQMTLARNGHAVSPVTSFLAIEPGVRPSTDGLEPYQQGFGSGHGRLSGSHATGSPVMRSVGASVFDAQRWLEGELLRVAAVCNAAGDLALTVENYGTEIVDVRDAKAPACVVEGMWGLELQPAFDAHVHWKLAVHR